MPLPGPFWPWLLVLLILVLGGLGLAYLLSNEDDDDSLTQGRQVPSVVGLTVPAAQARLARRSLRAALRPVQSDEPVGQVVRQRPGAGDRIATRGIVTLFVSRNPALVAVPNVVGASEAAAAARLQRAGLRARGENVFARGRPGRVVRQTPTAGAEIERGRLVVVYVSRGRQTVPVPDVDGLSAADARRQLERAGLRAVIVPVAASAEPGTVVAQNPRFGAQLPRGGTVRLNVARRRGAAPPPPGTTTPGARVTVPDVVGLREAEAAAEIEQAGLRADSFPVASEEAAGTVVRQSPAAGARANRGSPVRIDVSVGPTTRPLRQVPDVVGDDEGTAAERLRAAGFTVRTEDIEVTDPAQEGIVLEQSPAGGSRARSGAQVTISVGRAG